MQEVNASLHQRIDALMDNAEKRLSFEKWTGSVKDWQAKLRSELTELLAVDYTAGKITTEIVSERDMGSFTRQYIRMVTPDGIKAPAFAFVPKNITSPARAIICLHGHGPGKVVPAAFENDVRGNPVTIAGERDYAVQAAELGYISVAPDMRGFGELMLDDDLSAGRSDSCQQLSQRLMMVGKTLLGMRVYDSMCWVDYLRSLDEVDNDHIYITGQSGGGTGTLFSAAIDPRFAQAAPSCYFCTFRDSILAMSHCTCNYAPGMLNLCEMSDVAGLIAPRPMIVIAGQEDKIFPIEAVQRSYEKLQAIYDAFGAADNLELYIGPEGHRYYRARVWDFFNEHATQPAPAGPSA